MTASNEAMEKGLAAWQQCPVGVSPKQQMASILEAAAPIIRAEALEEAGDAADDPSREDMDTYFIDQSDVGRWLRARAVAERGRQ
jgi:hypothetical protein